MSHKVIGKSELRARVIDKVTGVQKYAHDRKIHGMLYAKLLRSEHARAKILSIDVSETLKLYGVVAVVRGEDIEKPMPRFGSVAQDQPLLADGEVKYHGEPVAAVVAQTYEIAEAALKTIKVEYAPQPSVCTVEEALNQDIPPVNGGESNVFRQFDFGWGDVEEAEKQSHYVLRDTYCYPMIFHFPIENYSCLAAPEDGGVVLYSPIQHPHLLRRVVADCLKLPFSKVRVIGEEIGGAFGGKGYAKAEPLAAYLALKLRTPVKIAMDMDEGFFMARRLAARVDITTGFDENAHITFQNIIADYLIGAYADAAPRVVQKAGYLSGGPYRTPHAKMIARAIHSNTVSSTAFRGFGMPQLVWAFEQQMNQAALHFGMDTLEIRRRNLPYKGETLVPGDIPVDGDWHEVLDKAAKLLDWGKKQKPGQGKSLAVGIKTGIPNSTSNAIVKLHSDGSVTVNAATAEMGQGARTVFAQIAAEKLCVPYQLVSVILSDTGAAPYDTSTAGSRSTVSMGTAVEKACEDVLLQVKELAADLAGMDIESIEVNEGVIRAGEREMTYSQLVQGTYGPNQGDIVGRGQFRGDNTKGHLLGGMADFYEFIIVGAAVTVDEKTGKIDVDKLVSASDIGKVMNHLQAKGQEEGGMIMGLGQAMMECMRYDPATGRLLNGNPLDYCVPTAMDISDEVAGVLIENADGPGPFGSKGMGEGPAIPVGPAVGGAVFDATGVMLRELPITSEKLFFALKDRDKNKSVS